MPTDRTEPPTEVSSASQSIRSVEIQHCSSSAPKSAEQTEPPRKDDHESVHESQSSSLLEQDNNNRWPESLHEDSIRLEVKLDGYPEDSPSDASRKAPDLEILKDYRETIQLRTAYHFGYPYNLAYDHEEVLGFLRYSINNLGDPFEPSNYAVHSRPFELAVIDFFARLWKIPKPDYWGYVTTSGTEGNLQGILLAREALPDGILYASRESHYSVFKAARFYRMKAVSVDTLHTGEINYSQLEEKISENLDKPVILNVNVGTTVKGAVDDLRKVLKVLESLKIPRERFYIHCDGALFALMLPFLKDAPQISFALPIDSMSVSGHKFLGCPMPCGVVVTRKEHVERLQSSIEYLSSKDTTIMGSRNGQSPLFLWYTLRKKGCSGLLKDVRQCMENARYLRDGLKNAGFSCMLNELSTTVVFERPHDVDLIKRWQLACERHIAHVVVMPNITKQKIDVFVADLIRSREQHSTKPSSAAAAANVESDSDGSLAQRCVKEDIGPFCVCSPCSVESS